MNETPLKDRRIAVTRARDQASELSAKLNALGVEVVELPLIQISEEISKQNLADTMIELGNYDWIVFTSANGVRFFFNQFFKLFDDIRALARPVLRHRILANFQAQSEKVTTDRIVEQLLSANPVPRSER